MILILGGTTEGRLAVKVADEAGKPFYYSTKGDMQLIESRNGIHLTGAMDVQSMMEFCKSHGIRCIIDAAHPFAVNLHDTAGMVSQEIGIPVIRLERRYPERNPDIIWCSDYCDAIEKLNRNKVNKLLALTGVQTIAKLKPFWSEHNCLFRILDRDESRKIAAEHGFPNENIIYYPGIEGASDSVSQLASIEQERLILEKIRPDAIITKESGESGGFNEKTQAALEMGIPVYAVMRPELPQSFIRVNGEHTLRKEIERQVPGYYELKSGYTTGSCATAASKAALTALQTGEEMSSIQFEIPNGEILTLPVQIHEIGTDYAVASVIKDAGDDPDITNGISIVSRVSLSDKPGIHFLQGQGVGRVTLPGLGIEIGEPAINRVPREMITRELSQLLMNGHGADVTISVPGGEELALKTFNPKLGIEGGISIIGTSGIVRPFSSEAFVEAIRREVEVSKATGNDRLVINSGARSERYVKSIYPDLPAQAFVHYGNYIGDTIRIAVETGFKQISMGIMIGKAVKLAQGNEDTHSRNVTMDRQFVSDLAHQARVPQEAIDRIQSMTLARELWQIIPKDNLTSFIEVVRCHCMNTLHPYLAETTLTIHILSDNGEIF